MILFWKLKPAWWVVKKTGSITRVSLTKSCIRRRVIRCGFTRHSTAGAASWFAATFGKVHGHYKPGAVKLRPEILRDGQKAVTDRHGDAAEFDLVFHGGFGTSKVQLQETLDYGVVKMNIDTDTQYAFTRSIADFILKHYDQVLMIDGEIGSKKAYDPRTTLKLAEAGVAARLQRACDDLKSSGRSILAKSDWFV